MEVNDFMDLNTTELFDDSNDSFDNNEDGNDSEIIISGSDDDNSRTSLSPDNECDAIMMDEIISSDAEKTSTDVVSLNFNFFSCCRLFGIEILPSRKTCSLNILIDPTINQNHREQVRVDLILMAASVYFITSTS